MRHVLVTGGAGFIGSHLTEALVRRGDRVRVLDNLSTGSTDNLSQVADKVEFVEGDVCERQAVEAAVRGVELVFHEAALASVPLSIDRPLDTHAACVTGTLNLLHAARQAGARRLVYAASSSAYGDRPSSPKRESDLPAALSPYAAAKLAGEHYCEAFYHSYGFETVCLRYFNVFGPRQDPDSPYSAVIPLFLTAMLEGRTPTIFGDGRQSRDFTFVGNIVHGNLLAAESESAAGNTYNLGDGQSVSLLELLEQLNEMLAMEVRANHEPARAGDVRESLADISRTQADLGFEPQVSFRDGLERSIAFYRSLVG